MRANNKQKIKALENILQQIVDNSKYIDRYEVDVLQTDDNKLFINITLKGGDVAIKQFGCLYFNALKWAKRTLYLSMKGVSI